MMSHRRGYTLLEMMIALIIGFVVLLALGRIILASQRSWEWGRDKVELQANTTEALEILARTVHASFFLAVPDSNSLRAFTLDDSGNIVEHHYQVASVAGQPRLQENGADVVARTCARFHVDANADTTSVTLTLVLANRVGDQVNEMTRATIRNRTLPFP